MITIDTRGLQRRLERYRDRLNNLRPAWRDVGQAAVESIYRTFARKGRPERWEPRKGKHRHNPLVKTRRLLQSTKFSVARSFVRVYNDARYAKYHQFGTRHMPKRVFLLTQDSDRETFARILERHIFGGDR